MGVKDLENAEELLTNVVSHEMASKGLKVLSYAYRDMTVEELNDLMHTHDDESIEFREAIESDLTYVGTFALHDPIREDISISVQLIKYGHFETVGDGENNQQVNVRMMTGDHIETARYVALKTGIISPEEANEDGVVITGEEFRARIGEYHKINDPWEVNSTGARIEFVEGRRKFDEVKKKAKVIARCTSEDKFVLVCGIKQKGGLVGMTGDSISDAEALKKADVGFCMGSGCDVAKDNSDLVILDNDFVSIHRSIKWGRAIFDNVRKFVQFQMTINIVICFVTILGGLTLGRPPLNVIQMLWVNLIMDILGAIALGTEPYKQDDVTSSSNRISRKDAIIRIEMWRQILVQAAYQIIVLVVIMYFGNAIFFEEKFGLVSTPLRDAQGNPTNRLVLNTICFEAFFFMNWFNQLNCRIIDAHETNIFKTILNNPYLWLVMALEYAIQWGFIVMGNGKLGSALLGTAPLTDGMWWTCLILGALSLAVNVGLKHIPLEHFDIVASKIDLETGKNSMIDAYMDKADDMYKKANSTLVAMEEED
jgi:P-type Ca2+ transporter type 2C